ncbi:MAG: BrnT family toxin [Bdellovibrionales bacterium]
MFEWDEEKNEINRTKHNVAFEHAQLIFDGSTLEAIDDRQDYGEIRVGAFGETEGEVFFVVYTMREEKHRLISARHASSRERDIYFSVIQKEGYDDEK